MRTTPWVDRSSVEGIARVLPNQDATSADEMR